MRALVLTAPDTAEIQDVPDPVAGPDQALVEVHRVGVCGTDTAFFRGTMPYLATGDARYPLRPGHEWAGRVVAVGTEVDESWLGRRVTGDTMLGCRRCDRCSRGLQHVCADRFEVGVLHGWHGAVAEQLVVPASSLYSLPDSVSDSAGAMVEPAANAARAVGVAGVGPGSRVAIIGPGSIGLMAASFAIASGAEVHMIGRSERGLTLARGLGVAGVWRSPSLPPGDFQVVVEVSGDSGSPQRAVDLAEPGGTVVLIGVSADPTVIDTRQLIVKDLSLVGDLSGSPAMAGTIASFADGSVDPVPLVAATVPLAAAGEVLAGWRPDDAGPGPKMHIDPRI